MHLPNIALASACAAIGAALLTASPALAADSPAKPKPEAFLTVAEAGQDYVDQGEYRNDWGGAQIIARGSDRFRLVTYKGGLPGDGWDNSPKTEVEGQRGTDGVVSFTRPNGWVSKVKNGEIVTTADQGQEYRMKKITRTSPTIGAKPPTGAVVLFDGSSAGEWENGKIDDRGWLRCGTKTKRKLLDGTLHIEFFLPFKPLGRGQDRANSGVYLQDRYEVQVLDSFGLTGENNECGGIYSKHKPRVNMCYPPLTWQTYDIDFTAPRFAADGKKTQNARVTVRHNGVLVHDQAEINGLTASPGPGGESADPSPIQLQDHGNPVFYRNIWFVEKH